MAKRFLGQLINGNSIMEKLSFSPKFVDNAKRVVAPIALAISALGCNGGPINASIRTANGGLYTNASVWVSRVDGLTWGGYIDPKSGFAVGVNVVKGGTSYNAGGVEANWFGGRTPVVEFDQPGTKDRNGGQ